MKFGAYVFQLYGFTPEGRAAIGEFDVLLDVAADAAESPAPTDEQDETVAEESTLDSPSILAQMLSADERAIAVGVCTEASLRIEGGAAPEELYERLLEEGCSIEVDGTDVTVGGADGESEWLRWLHGITLGLAMAAPETFAPYWYRLRFDEFEQLCGEFEIPLPRLPGKSGLRERCIFYLQINQVLQEFRSRHELSPAELCAFLYDFAASYAAEESSELGEAGKAWFLMGGVGGPGDFEFLDAATEDDASHWQGNLETQRGDIGIMWCVSPRSSVHSIWRATTHGFIDPFFHYYSTIWIGHPVKVPAVTFKELQADPVWSTKPAVRAHFQGASGKPVTAEEYEALLAMLERKGFDRKLAPTLRARDFGLEVEIESERDVEEKLLEPLLLELGYVEKDWTRQLRLRMGRGERVYPDYVFLAQKARHDEVAHWIVEAKHAIRTHRELLVTYQQAKSYALRLQARVFVLVAKEGLWLFEAGRVSFTLDNHVHRTWAELRHPDAFRALQLKLGKAAFAKPSRS